MQIISHLISGAGNTFHVVCEFENKQLVENCSVEILKNLTQKICSDHPADGFIFLRKQKTDVGYDYDWNFYNRDGSDAEMCGNATRCVGFAIRNIEADLRNEWWLKTIAGLIHIEFVEKEKYKITMTSIVPLSSEKGFFCDTGVPHLVLEVGSLDDFSRRKLEARALRFDPTFQPRGTNITYVELLNEAHHLKGVSYERGVEDFTQACGTGAMAAAFYNLTKRGVNETTVEMPGGTLMMNLSDLKRPTMTGSAKLLGSYKYEFSKKS